MRDMPSACALRVIISAKLSSSPPMVLCDSHRDVVGRARDDRLDRVFDAEALAGVEAEFGRRLARRVRRHRNRRFETEATLVELFEQEIERHHLGERRRMAQFVFAGRIERAARISVDDDRGVGRIGRGSPLMANVVASVTPMTRFGRTGENSNRGERDTNTGGKCANASRLILHKRNAIEPPPHANSR